MKHFYITLFFIVSFFTAGFAQDEFIFTWQATDDQKELSLPTSGSGYNYTVDWGDGDVDSNQTGIAFHTYASNGTYTITIDGVYPSIAFGLSPDFRVPAQLVSVEQWGTNAWTDMTRAFSGCSNLVINATDVPDLTNTTSLEKMFDGTTNFVDDGGELGNWNVSTIENMTDMFRNSGMNVQIGSWNVGNVIDFTGMFTGNTAFNQNISGWNIGEFVTGTINMRTMFDSASSFNNPLNAWDISKVTNMSSMFGFATSFNQPLDNWNTSSVQNMGGMFFGASDFDQNVGDWNLSSVTAMGAMFQLAGLSTTNYDATLIGWATQDAGETIPSNISISFEGSQYCFGVDARNILTDPSGFNWNISDDGAACATADFFITIWETTTNDESITIPTTGSGYNYTVDWGDGTLETGFTGNASHSYATAGTHTIRILGDFPRIYFNNSGDRNKIQTIEQWGAIAWDSMESAFRRCENLEVKATDSPNLSNVTSLAYMFSQCSSLDKDFPVDFSGWDTSGIQEFTWAFADAVAFNSSSIANWDVSEVTNFGFMFIGATAFDQDLSAWDISSARTMESMIRFTSMSEENYDKTLIGWATLESGETQIPSNVVLEVDTTFCLGVNAKNTLINAPYNWSIEDEGLGCPDEDLFITTWNIATDFENITLPVVGTGLDFVVDWGDGTVTFETQEAYHTYENAGTYTMRVLGNFNRLNFDGYPSSNNIQTIEKWGPNSWTSMEDAFNGCTNLKLNADDVPDLSSVSSTQHMFQGCTNLEDLQDKINDWDMSAVTDTSSMFENCTLFNEVISNWNVANVETMNAMFQSATAFDQSLGSWDISTANTMDNMLVNTGITSGNYDATLIGWATLEPGETQIPSDITLDADATYCLGEDARNILTSTTYNWIINDSGNNCTDAFITTWLLEDNDEIEIRTNSAYSYNYTIDWGDGTVDYDITTDISHEYTTAGTYEVSITGEFPRFTLFFRTGRILRTKIQTIEQWGNIQWRDFRDSFNGCENLKLNADDTPDLSQVTELSSMFEGCSNFEDLKGQIGNWDTRNISDFDNMFYEATSFNESLGNWDISAASSMYEMFVASGMSQENYDATLIGWATLEAGETQIPSNVDLDADTAYCLAEAAHDLLTSTTYNWTINDGGLNCDFTNAFITTWETTGINESITIPTTGDGYSYAVDWGDGIVETGFTGNATHEYDTAGTYTVRIIGDFLRIYFNSSSDRNKIRTIEQWGSIAWDSMESAFRRCENLEVKATDSPDLSNVTSLAYMFSQCSSLDKDFPVDFSGWDTSGIQEFTWAFADAVAFNSSSIANWDVSEVTNFGFMFIGATAFDQDLSAWDISSARTMESMIRFTSMSEENYDKTLIGWATLDTASGEIQIPSNVDLEVDATFCLGVNAKKTLINAPYDWYIEDEGLGCADEDLFITTWNIATDFENITLPVVGSGLDFVVDWGDGTVTFETQEAYHTYENAGTYTMRILGNFNRLNFDGYPSSNNIQTIEQWGPNSWTSMEDAFNGCTNLKLNADDVPDLSSVSSTQHMFQGCTNLEDLQDKINDWDMSAVTDTSSMFENCTLFNEVISNWNVANVETMNAMFQSATAFDQSLGSWDISAANTMDNMLVDAGMSSENYDKTLIGWATLDIGETQIPSDITFDASATYCLGEAARNILTDASGLNWTISDDGLGCAPTDAFITTWTVADGGQITIPNFSMFITHNYNVDWGDGTFSIGNTSSTSHTYTSGGTYTVSITGNMPTIFFGIADNTTKESLQTIEQWGNQKWEYLNAGFAGCTNLKLNADDTPDLSVVSTEDIGSMFNGCTNFEDLKDQIGNWDMSQVQDISFMFFNCSVFNEDISTWSFDNLTNTTNTFSNALSFNQDVSNWDMSNLERGIDMFKGASTFDQNLSSWDLSSLTIGLDEIFVGTALSQENYDNTLIGWATLEAGETQIPNGIDLVADATYCLAEAARNTLLSAPYNWSITDGGQSCIDPIITLLGDNPQVIERGDAYGELGAEVTYGAIVTINATSVDTDVVGNYSVTYDAINTVSGATAAQVTRMVEVVDTTAPVITLNGPNPQIIELGDPYVELGATTDDGSPVTLDTNIDLLVSDVGTYTAMYFAADVHGNSSIVFRTVEVVDTTAPVITLNGPNPQIIELGDPYVELGATTDDGSPVTLDTNIDLLVSDVGAYSAMYFAADANGNTSIVFRTVEVVDTTNPTVVCQNITVQLDDTGNASITAAMIDNGSTDLSGIASLAIDMTDFDCTNVGDNMVTLTVTDAHGNTDMCMATVTIEDTISPEFDISTVPTDMEVPFDTGDMYTLADFTSAVVVTDNCDSNRKTFATTITQSPVAGTLLGAGDHVITLTAIDDHLNIETVSFTITVSGILGVEENEEHLFTVYPNPAKDQVWITGLRGEAEVTISDINGRLLRTIKVMNDQAISTRDLSEGVYLITIKQNDINQTMRLMKN